MRRFLIVAAGVSLAFAAASLALAFGVVVEATLIPERTGAALFDVMALIVAHGVAGTAGDWIWMATRAVRAALATVCFAPIAVVAVIGEAVQMRSRVAIAGCTGALTAALPLMLSSRGDSVASGGVAGEERVVTLLFLTGVIAGLVYGLVAGGRARKRE